MITVNEITTVIREQEAKMQSLFDRERILTRELDLSNKRLVAGVGNIITGPRRSGKLVFAFMLGSRYKFGYINFDDERLTIQSKELNKVLEAIYALKGNVDFLVLDEIQEIDGWKNLFRG